MEQIDLVVVGAGWYGLTAAKTYREVNPLRCVVVVEQASTVGGVWAHHRLAPGLHTEYRVGSYEYCDFPLDPAEFGLAPGQRIPGEVIHTYMERYVDWFHLRDHIWLDTRVVTVERCLDESWKLTMVKSGGDGRTTTILQTRKLIIATGSTKVSTVGISGSEEFGGPVVHVRDLAQHAQSIIRPNEIPVTVVGSSWDTQDVVSMCASVGRPVDWVVSEREGISLSMALSETTRWSRILQGFLTTRFFSLFSPCIWDEDDWLGSFRRFLQHNWLGQKAAKGFWGFVTRNIQQGICVSEVEHPGIQQARERLDPYWMGIPDPNPILCDFIRKGIVKIHVADINHISSKAIHLSTGYALGGTALVHTIGAPSSSIRFLPSRIEKELGITGSADMRVAQEASQEFRRLFPDWRGLQMQNSVGEKPDMSYCSLTRFMVPPSIVNTPSIVFLGTVIPTHAPLVAPTQALWAATYLGGKLHVMSGMKCPESLREQVSKRNSGEHPHQAGLDHVEDIWWETALHSEFGRLRYPGGVGEERRFQYDVLSYLDLLVRDLGLNKRRKPGILAELWSPYRPSDYRGLTEEWKAQNRGTDRLERMADRGGKVVE